MWLCGACGNEYTHGINEHSEVVSRGQSLRYQYIVFITVPFSNGVKTLCAMAKAPSDYNQNVIHVRKIVAAHRACIVPKGARACLIDLMVRSNDMFEAVIRGFPRWPV